MLPLENSIIDEACAALNGMERSMLVQEAVLVEACRLGIGWSSKAAPAFEGQWPYLPVRGEATGERTSITMSLALAELLARCAEHVGTSEPLFIVGATLAYIGRLQALFRGTRAETREDAQGIRADLQRIKLPAQYRYRGGRTAA
jgi:hypothetical protein